MDTSEEVFFGRGSGSSGDGAFGQRKSPLGQEDKLRSRHRVSFGNQNATRAQYLNVPYERHRALVNAGEVMMRLRTPLPSTAMANGIDHPSSDRRVASLTRVFAVMRLRSMRDSCAAFFWKSAMETTVRLTDPRPTPLAFQLTMNPPASASWHRGRLHTRIAAPLSMPLFGKSRVITYWFLNFYCVVACGEGRLRHMRSSLWAKPFTPNVVACRESCPSTRNSLWRKLLTSCVVACGDGGEPHQPPLPNDVLKSIAESGKKDGATGAATIRQATMHSRATRSCGYENSSADVCDEATDGGITFRYDHDYDSTYGTSLESRLVPPSRLCRRQIAGT